MSIRVGAIAIAALGVLVLAGCATQPSRTPATDAAPAPRPSAQPSTSDTWPSYHYDQSRTGSVQSAAPSEPTGVIWKADLGAAVYGQPVVAGGLVVAAAENNRVAALDPSSGTIRWSVSVGTPLRNVAAVAGCGNVDPLGITSTPAVDLATGTVYVVAEVVEKGAVHHRLTGIDIASGRIVRSERVDPPLPKGESPKNLLQRAGLAIAGGRVYIAYGGNAGDCGSYHGWVVSVRETGAPGLQSFQVASDGEGGAIWESGGAPAIDAAGNVYVTTGNANPDPPEGGPDPKKFTESVVKLSPTLKPLASYKDVVAGGDEDLATGNPVLLPNGLVFAIGKTDVAYVLRQSDLTKVTEIKGICGSDPDGGPAYDATTNRMYVPCRGGGIQLIDLTAKKAGHTFSGANSAPLLIGTKLWAAQYPDGTLSEYDTVSGSRLQRLSAGSSVPHFATPSTAFGTLFLGTDHGVVAFG